MTDALQIVGAVAQMFSGLGNMSFSANRNGNGNVNMTDVRVSTAPNTAVPPGSTSGSTSSSTAAAATQSGSYYPQPSDLAYLLHDNDEEVFDDDTLAPAIPVPVKYIVDNLSDYGLKCIPLKVYVSALLRTWETAVLLYLPFLFNKDTPKDYSQTLILEVSPFLLEDRSKFDITTMNSNLPLDFAGNVNEFFGFIKLFIYLNNQGKSFITGVSELCLKEIPNNFTIILIAGNDKIYLRINILEDKFEYYAPKITLDPGTIIIPPQIIKKINDEIANQIQEPSDDAKNTKYESYNDNRLTTNKEIPPQTIYSTFQLWGVNINFNNFETIAKFGPDIFSFLKWVIEFKCHPKNTPILFVSHSGTMNNFLKIMISNLNYNYSAAAATSLSPTTKFVEVCTKSRETNTWSMRFKYLDFNVTGSRHAQSCDNMYKTLDEEGKYFKKISSAVGAPTRNKLGKYTNLSLWGIFSTLVFTYINKEVISNFNDASIRESGLLVLSGMDKQSKTSIETFGMQNELTCGDFIKRFTVPSTRPTSGVASTTSSLNFTPIANLVDIIPPSIPFQNMDITTRQQMSNELYSLDSIFKIEFMDCDNGCKIKVKYIGPYNFTSFIPGANFNTFSPEDKKIIEALLERKVYITIDKSRSNYVLTLQNVYKGGLVIGQDGSQAIKSSLKQMLPDTKEDIPFELADTATFNDNNPEKIEISSDFQKSVGFLMGFDLIKASVITYDIPYNTLILYSNLLIRQLLTTHLLVTSYQKKSNITLFNPSRDVTKAFLEKGTQELYGGKNNKKHKKNKKHNNPKK